MEKYIGYIILFAITLYVFYIFEFKVLKFIDMKRIANQLTSSRRFLIFLSGYLVLVSFYALIFGFINADIFKTLLTFCGAVSGVGLVAVGGEKLVNGKYKNGESK